MGLKTTRWVLVATILIAIAPTMAASQGFYEPRPQYFAQPLVRIGYLFPNSATKLTFDSTSGTALAIQDLGLSINVRGVWTEFAVPVRGFGPVGLVVGFSYLFPVNKHSQETYELAPPASRQRDWTSRYSAMEYSSCNNLQRVSFDICYGRIQVRVFVNQSEES